MEESKGTDKKQCDSSKPWLFKPGESGNPNGRPMGVKNFTTKIRDALLKIAVDDEGKKTDYTYEQALVKTVLEKAIKGKDPNMIKLMWNYLDGMPSQQIDFTGELDTFSHRELDSQTEEELKEFIAWKKGKILK
jgi:hypothetical protein